MTESRIIYDNWMIFLLMERYTGGAWVATERTLIPRPPELTEVQRNKSIALFSSCPPAVEHQSPLKTSCVLMVCDDFRSKACRKNISACYSFLCAYWCRLQCRKEHGILLFQKGYYVGKSSVERVLSLFLSIFLAKALSLHPINLRKIKLTFDKDMHKEKRLADATPCGFWRCPDRLLTSSSIMVLINPAIK